MKCQFDLLLKRRDEFSQQAFERMQISQDITTAVMQGKKWRRDCLGELEKDTPYAIRFNRVDLVDNPVVAKWLPELKEWHGIPCAIPSNWSGEIEVWL